MHLTLTLHVNPGFGQFTCKNKLILLANDLILLLLQAVLTFNQTRTTVF